MLKIKTYWQAVMDEERDHEVPVGESLTVQEGYESLEDMIPRIVRGEIRPVVPQFEFSDKVSDDVFEQHVYDDMDDLTDIDAANAILAKYSSSKSDVIAEGDRKEDFVGDASVAREKLTKSTREEQQAEVTDGVSE